MTDKNEEPTDSVGVSQEDADWMAFSTEADWQNFEELAAQVPETEVLYSTLNSYPRMDPAKEGSWEFLKFKGQNVLVIWTDWQTATGVIPLYASDMANDLNSYLSSAVSMGLPAGSAYTSMRVYITNTAPGGAELVENNSGPLSNVLNSVMRQTDQIIEPTLEDDDVE